MDRPTRLQSTTLRLSAVLGALSLIAAACAGAASPPVPTTACASVTLSVADADLEGGFLATPLAAPEAGVTVQAVLAIGGNGPQLAGRTIAYAGELAGTSAVTDSAGAVAAFEATTSGDRSGAGGCPGSVRLAIPHGQGWGKGFAWVGATLGHLDVSVASPETCTSLELGGGSVAVECPTVAVRIGE